MGKCVRCGLQGAFVTVNDQGLCVLCQKTSASARAPERKTVRPEDLNPEDVLTRYLTTSHRTYPSGYLVTQYYTAEFQCMLDSLPHVAVERMMCTAPAGTPECVILRTLDGCVPADCANFVAIDTETSGLDARAEIVEVSAVQFCNFRPVRVFSTLCRPYRPIAPSATAIHGITNRDVKDAPRFAEILSSLEEFTDGMPLVAHNAPFDLKMLAREGFPTAGRQVFDTLSVARKRLRDPNGKALPGYRLAEACKACAILFSGAHRSSADAMAAGLLFLELVKRHFETENLMTLPLPGKN